METTIQLLHLLSIFHFLQYSRAILNQHLFPGSSVECKVSDFSDFLSNIFLHVAHWKGKTFRVVRFIFCSIHHPGGSGGIKICY